MNLITAGSIVCLYPTTTLNRRFMENTILCTEMDSMKANAIVEYHQLLPTTSVKFNAAPCTNFCDYTGRTSLGSQGIGHFHWNAEYRPGLGMIHYKWHLHEACQNPYCPHYLLPPRICMDNEAEEYGNVAREYSNQPKCMFSHSWFISISIFHLEEHLTDHTSNFPRSMVEIEAG